MSQDPTHITRLEEGGAVVLGLGGEFDIASAELLRGSLEEVLEAGSPHVVLDLSKTEFLDSTVLGVMVSAGRRARESGGWLRLVNPRANVRNLLRLTKMDTVFGLYDTVTQAVEHQRDH